MHCVLQERMGIQFAALHSSVLSSLTDMRQSCVASHAGLQQLLDDCTVASPQVLDRRSSGSTADSQTVQSPSPELQLQGGFPGSSTELLSTGMVVDVPSVSRHCCQTALSTEYGDKERIPASFSPAAAVGGRIHVLAESGISISGTLSEIDLAIPSIQGLGYCNRALQRSLAPETTAGRALGLSGGPSSDGLAVGEAAIRALAAAAATQLQALDALIDQVRRSSITFPG